MSDQPLLKAIVFSHGNSFPAGTYGVLFEAWRKAGFAVHAIDKIGHDPRFAVTNNWPQLRDQLIAFVEEIGGPVWLVGPSLGERLLRSVWIQYFSEPPARDTAS